MVEHDPETNGVHIRLPAVLSGSEEKDALFELHHDAWGRLVLTDAAGRQYVDVEPVRSFPLTAPREGIAICDTEGRELVWVENLDSLRSSVRQVLLDEFSQREFLPIIRGIVGVSTKESPAEWEVETDRGRTRFLVNGENDIHRLAFGGAIITDAHGIRYLIPDPAKLDSTSKRILNEHL